MRVDRVPQEKECLECESNTRPSDLQSDALPTELSRLLLSQVVMVSNMNIGSYNFDIIEWSAAGFQLDLLGRTNR